MNEKVKLLGQEDLATIMRFYDAETNDELIASLCAHVERLQERLLKAEHPLMKRFEVISPRIG